LGGRADDRVCGVGHADGIALRAGPVPTRVSPRATSPAGGTTQRALSNPFGRVPWMRDSFATPTPREICLWNPWCQSPWSWSFRKGIVWRAGARGHQGFSPNVVQEAPQWLTILRLWNGFRIPGWFCRKPAPVGGVSRIDMACRMNQVNLRVESFFALARPRFL
jgi:hypothetical protein